MVDTRPVIDRAPALPGRRGPSEIRAAIDLGTNSFHLVVARVDADGQFDVLDRDKEVVRLGSGAGVMRLLTPEAIVYRRGGTVAVTKELTGKPDRTFDAGAETYAVSASHGRRSSERHNEGGTASMCEPVTCLITVS